MHEYRRPPIGFLQLSVLVTFYNLPTNFDETSCEFCCEYILVLCLRVSSFHSTHDSTFALLTALPSRSFGRTGRIRSLAKLIMLCIIASQHGLRPRLTEVVSIQRMVGRNLTLRHHRPRSRYLFSLNLSIRDQYSRPRQPWHSSPG